MFESIAATAVRVASAATGIVFQVFPPSSERCRVPSADSVQRGVILLNRACTPPTPAPGASSFATLFSAGRFPYTACLAFPRLVSTESAATVELSVATIGSAGWAAGAEAAAGFANMPRSRDAVF